MFRSDFESIFVFESRWFGCALDVIYSGAVWMACRCIVVVPCMQMHQVLVRVTDFDFSCGASTSLIEHVVSP